MHAVALKLTEQRKFVLWWDGQEKNPGGRPSKKPVAESATGFSSPEDFGLDKFTLHRWRTRLKEAGMPVIGTIEIEWAKRRRSGAAPQRPG